MTGSLILSTSSVHGQVQTYTTQSSFLNKVATGAYFESFNSFSGQNTVSPQAFSSGGFSYTLSDDDASGIYYSDGSGASGSVFPSVNHAGESFVITFTSGNVTAIGGTFFLTDVDFDPLAGNSVMATLATGQSIVLASTNSYDTEPFGGFTSSIPITSLTLTAPAIVGSIPFFNTLDNLYVGRSTYAAVPEPKT